MSIDHSELEGLSPEELEQKFLADANLFYGPDPEIMADHDISHRSPREEELLARPDDRELFALVRSKIQAGLNESFEMMEQMGAAPGAKWGDLISALFTGSGDLAAASSGGVLLFSTLVHHPVKFILKYWKNERTVGINPGDVFMHNDSRYGNIHNTDQSIIVPIFHEGELICWAGATVHEGENGAVEPGGMPSAAESPYMEGLKMSPFKVGVNYELKRDLVTFLQNSVREPKLQFEDMKAKLFTCLRTKLRVEEAIAEFGVEAVIATLRRTLEDTREEATRRIRQWPDGVTRSLIVADGTLRENVMVKIQLQLRKQGDELIFDFRGSSPEFTNRANNTVLASLKGMINQIFLTFVWPDLPRNQGVFAPVRFVTDPNSALNSSYMAPNAQSMMTFFPAFTASWVAIQKFLYPGERKYTSIVAPWYNMINTFIYGGITQYGEMVGNLCADLNAMGGGAKWDIDGEHSLQPIFCSMADTGEQEIIETEVPFMQLVSKHFMKDNQGYGKFRGGSGYQMMVATKDSNLWGFMTCCIGSKINNVPGLFGGYGSQTYPLCKVRGVDVFEILQNNPESFKYTIEEIMNTRPWAEASYNTHHMGLQFELVKRGELYMISQGCGGGYGDPMDRDPALVAKDLEDELISEETVRDIYHVVVDPDLYIVDHEGTKQAREAERQSRMSRGRPFDEFVQGWTTDKPPPHLPWYGTWNDPTVVYAGGADVSYPVDSVPPIFMPDPRDVRIAQLEAQLAQLEGGGEQA